jgi:hypothetical protein
LQDVNNSISGAIHKDGAGALCVGSIPFIGVIMPRGNEQNLIRNEDLTPEQRRENTSKAGVASGEARRKRKTLREELLALLADGDTQERVSLALIREAQLGNNSGSVARAFETIRDTVGEKPTESMVLTANVNTGYDELTADELRALLKQHEDGRI